MEEQISNMPDSSRLAEDALTRPRTSIGPQSSTLTSERASQQYQPISEAVTSAVQDASRTAQFDPELISTIVAKVLEQVMMHPTPQHALQSTPVMQIPISHSHIPQSPPQFTPPTPGASFTADFDDRDLASPSPGPALSDSGSHFSQLSMGSMRSDADSRDETPRPPRACRSNRSSRSFHSSSVDAVAGSNASMLYQGVRSRNDSKASDAARTALPMDEVPRPKISEESETPLERTWQPLFLNGEATPRLSQFLRGIALHLISNVEPRNSLVVTPEKMIQFFSGTRVDGEHYPWESIFKGMAPYSISNMYRKLEIEHHLVQIQPRDKPSIPGLTSEGFAMYLTLLIRAHPDIEYERMTRVIKDMAICNADNVKERFPKELPRQLFPSAGDVDEEKRLISSLSHEGYVLKEISGAADMPLQVGASPAQQWQRPEQSYPERERQPYSRNVMSNAFDDDDLNSPMFPIERERQDFVAKPPPRPYATERNRNIRGEMSQEKAQAADGERIRATREKFRIKPAAAPAAQCPFRNHACLIACRRAKGVFPSRIQLVALLDQYQAALHLRQRRLVGGALSRLSV